MGSFTIKLLSIPIVLWIASYFLADIYYPSFYQPILTGLAIAVIGRLAERLLLKQGTVTLSAIADAILSILIIYYSQYIFSGARVTLNGAIAISIIIGIMEYAVHAFLVGRDRQHS